MPKKTNGSSSMQEQERFTAALSYVWILSLYTLLFKRNSAFIQFHARQGVALFVLETVSFLFLFLAPIVIIACVILSIWGIKEALSGKYWTVPFIGEYLKDKTL